MMQIGKYKLQLISVPEGEKPPFEMKQHIWIEHESGEGMSTRTSNLEAVIAKFFAENF